MFYVSKILLDAETHYSVVKKMVLALVNVKKKLRHYVETHSITVIIDFPIKQILSKPNLSGKLTKWAIDLGIYDIRYTLKVAKKWQDMADFLVEMQSFSVEPEQLLHTEEEFQTWALNTDRASNSTGAGIRIVLEAHSGLKIDEAWRLSFQATNNEAEYEALIYRLELVKHFGIKLLKVRSDLKLITEQVARRFEANKPRMRAYFDRAYAFSRQF